MQILSWSFDFPLFIPFITDSRERMCPQPVILSAALLQTGKKKLLSLTGMSIAISVYVVVGIVVSLSHKIVFTCFTERNPSPKRALALTSIPFVIHNQCFGSSVNFTPERMNEWKIGNVFFVFSSCLLQLVLMMIFSQSKRIASRFSTKRTLERCGCTRKFFLSKIFCVWKIIFLRKFEISKWFFVEQNIKVKKRIIEKKNNFGKQQKYFS